MEEYEYSFKVNSIVPYIEYCKLNNYKLKKEVKQNRVVYENINNDKIIARITTEDKDNKKTKVINFKNLQEKNNKLKFSYETIPLQITNKNSKAIESILDVLEFKKASDLYRIRRVYEKDGVIFEIDEYKMPKMNVVAIEGLKDRVDKIYKETCNYE